jgi:hypothetical protein
VLDKERAHIYEYDFGPHQEQAASAR